MAGLLLNRFLDAAQRFPDRPALAPRGRSVSYGELARMTGAAAASLADVAGPGDRIAILAENSPEYAAVVYGSWSAGQAVVGLNPALRAEELERLIRHAGASAVVLDSGHPEAALLQERLAGETPLLAIDEAADPDAGAGEPSPGPAPASEALAAIIYTSGTTGHPKGVMLSHRNLAANTASIQASLPIRQDDRALCVLPFQYSYGASILNTHLTLGATILSERSLMYPLQVLERVEQESATSLAGVPSTFYLLLERTDLSAYDLSSLRYVTQAGGHMDPERIARFRALLPHVEFVVMYGQTEASARLTCLPPAELDRKMGSAGRAIPGVQLEIRGEDGGPLPTGELGEVCARGENVMQGYWGDAEETGKVIVDGWLCTGDLGRMDEDGHLRLEGRAREMIKSGAYRIAPAEVEEVIRRVPGVFDVAVVGAEDPILGEAVHAHVVTQNPGRETELAILRTCKQHLARYKLPKRVHFRADLPRTASGKVRKHLL